MMKLLSLCLAAVMLLMYLVGCGRAATPSGSDTGVTTAGTTTTGTTGTTKKYPTTTRPTNPTDDAGESIVIPTIPPDEEELQYERQWFLDALELLGSDPKVDQLKIKSYNDGVLQTQSVTDVALIREWVSAFKAVDYEPRVGGIVWGWIPIEFTFYEGDTVRYYFETGSSYYFTGSFSVMLYHEATDQEKADFEQLLVKSGFTGEAATWR